MPNKIHELTTTGLILALCTMALSCRSSGDYRVRTLPDPVPIDESSGRGYFIVEIQSLSRYEARLSQEGLRIPAGGRVRFDASLPLGRDRLELDLQETATRRRIRLELPVQLVHGPRLEDLDFPIPALGDHRVRITSGFHTANHRRPGHRLALDLVPVLPEGQSAFGTKVFAPFRCLVLAFTEEEPDRPGHPPNEILLRDEQGRVWRYSHFQQGSIPLRIDRWVEKGALLGRIGLSGHTTGPHLHIELTPPLAGEKGQSLFSSER